MSRCTKDRRITRRCRVRGDGPTRRYTWPSSRGHCTSWPMPVWPRAGQVGIARTTSGAKRRVAAAFAQTQGTGTPRFCTLGKLHTLFRAKRELTALPEQALRLPADNSRTQTVGSLLPGRSRLARTLPANRRVVAPRCRDPVRPVSREASTSTWTLRYEVSQRICSPLKTMPRVLRKPEVLARVGVSSTTLWRMQRAGRFPPSFHISPGLVGWLDADVDRWIETQGHASLRRTPSSSVSPSESALGTRQANSEEPRR